MVDKEILLYMLIYNVLTLNKVQTDEKHLKILKVVLGK